MLGYNCYIDAQCPLRARPPPPALGRLTTRVRSDLSLSLYLSLLLTYDMNT